MRLILVTLASVIVCACSPKAAEEKAPQTSEEIAANAKDSANVGPVTEVTEGEPKTIEDMRAASLAEIDREACESAGGEVRQEGMLGLYRCVKPYSDAGKSCRSSGECEGKCLVVDDAATGEDAVGACQKDDSPFGCYSEVEDGKVANAICVD